MFDAASRAFIAHSAGISVLDPPYTSILFTIPGNFESVAITPDGNQLLATDFDGRLPVVSPPISIFTSPFSALSTPQHLAHGIAGKVDGIVVTPDGTRALVAVSQGGGDKLVSIAAPFSSTSTVDYIELPSESGFFETVSVSADGQFAMVAGGGGSPVVVVRAPFTTAGATVCAFPVEGGRGAGAVQFLPAGLQPSPGSPTTTPTPVPTATAGTTATVVPPMTPIGTATTVPSSTPVVSGTPRATSTATATATPTNPPITCPPVPALGCLQNTRSKRSRISITDWHAQYDKKDRVEFTWVKGDPSPLALFGDPVNGGTSYAVCMYDGNDSVVFRASIPAGPLVKKIGWAKRGNRFFYADKTTAEDGAKRIRLVTNNAAQARLTFVGRGKNVNLGNDGIGNLPDVGTFPIAVAPGAITFQFINSLGNCWESKYSNFVGKNLSPNFRRSILRARNN